MMMRMPEILLQRLQRIARRRTKDDHTGLDPLIGGWRRAGWTVAAVFLGGTLLWAGTTRLDAAAIADGVVGVESNRKSVAHLEGGIVKEILVSEGSRVERGQVLLRLEATQARAALDLLAKRRTAALAEQARLRAERDGADEVAFPDELVDRAEEPEVADLLVAQVDLFNSRRDRVRGQKKVLAERILKQKREINGYRAQVSAHRQRIKLLREEKVVLDRLAEKGLVAKTQILEIRRRIAEQEGNAGDYAARIARAETAIAELEAQIAQPDDRQRNQVADQIQKVQVRLAELQEQIAAAGDVLVRTEVRAPAAGRVVDLRVHTPGGVVRPGEPLLDLVPGADALIIDLRIDPRDIDIVREGMPARARLTAFSARTTPPVEGTLVSVSPDRTTDPATGRAYFSGRMRPDPKATGLDPEKLGPGMQAEVFLVAAERTVLDYLVEPVARSVDRAGREM